MVEFLVFCAFAQSEPSSRQGNVEGEAQNASPGELCREGRHSNGSDYDGANDLFWSISSQPGWPPWSPWRPGTFQREGLRLHFVMLMPWLPRLAISLGTVREIVNEDGCERTTVSQARLLGSDWIADIQGRAAEEEMDNTKKQTWTRIALSSFQLSVIL